MNQRIRQETPCLDVDCFFISINQDSKSDCRVSPIERLHEQCAVLMLPVKFGFSGRKLFSVSTLIDFSFAFACLEIDSDEHIDSMMNGSHHINA